MGARLCRSCGKPSGTRPTCKTCRRAYRKPQRTAKKKTTRRNKQKSGVFHERLRALGFATYDEFLASDLWYRTRSKYFTWRTSVGLPKKCEFCDAKERLAVHHVTYDRIGNEVPMDFRLLCKRCHEGVHRMHRRVRGSLEFVTDCYGDMCRTGKGARSPLGERSTPALAG